MPRKPNDNPETLKVVPLEPTPMQPRTAGRPRKLPMPPLPKFELKPYEQQWFDWIIQTYELENPDLTDTDKMSLPLIAIEYIKYLRVAGKELAEGEVISMARQHPMTNLARLMENLSVTRKARKAEKQPREEDEAAKQRAKLIEMLG